MCSEISPKSHKVRPVYPHDIDIGVPSRVSGCYPCLVQHTQRPGSRHGEISRAITQIQRAEYPYIITALTADVDVVIGIHVDTRDVTQVCGVPPPQRTYVRQTYFPSISHCTGKAEVAPGRESTRRRGSRVTDTASDISSRCTHRDNIGQREAPGCGKVRTRCPDI